LHIAAFGDIRPEDPPTPARAPDTVLEVGAQGPDKEWLALAPNCDSR
jgi:hypothetical protein